MVALVPGLWPGETAEIRITGKKGRAALGEVKELLEPSADRIQPECPHHGFATATAQSNAVPCGGCPWQFVRYDAQLAQKQKRVTEYFDRLGAADAVKPIQASPQIYGYRNRAQLKSDGRRLGFVAEGSRQLAPVDDCLILSDKNRQTLRSLRAQLPNPAWRPAKAQQWVKLDIDESVSADTLLAGQRPAFRQANNAINLRMQKWLAHKLQQYDAPRVLELFCGDGNFTGVINAAGAGLTLAVEGFAPALERLQSRALNGVDTLHANLFSEGVFERIYQQEKQFDVLVLDPPREGLKVYEGLVPRTKPFSAIYYISCDIATLVRDVARLQSDGYSVTEVQPLDQFPHTPHIECLVEMQLHKSRGKRHSAPGL